MAGAAFSPRLAAIYTPWPGQVFRVAVATAFRYPNLNENLLDLEQQLPVPRFLPPNAGFTGMSVSIHGNPDLRKERIRLAEVAHRGRFGTLENTLAGYHCRLRDIIVFQAHPPGRDRAAGLPPGGCLRQPGQSLRLGPGGGGGVALPSLAFHGGQLLLPAPAGVRGSPQARAGKVPPTRAMPGWTCAGVAWRRVIT
ncbi:MAG: TonB-dependent receptor [Candidatus Handelsmanbacteria bacterium]|nr:TonB-dependent receptor [Candidatus Handelsmanbacteria bacterium]